MWRSAGRLHKHRHAGDQREAAPASDERRVGHGRAVAADDPTGGQSEGRHQQDRDDEEDAGIASWIRTACRCRARATTRSELLDHAEDERADAGHREAREPADHGGAVGVEHQQGEHDGVEVLAAGEEHPAEGGQPRSRSPS